MFSKKKSKQCNNKVIKLLIVINNLAYFDNFFGESISFSETSIRRIPRKQPVKNDNSHKVEIEVTLVSSRPQDHQTRKSLYPDYDVVAFACSVLDIESFYEICTTLVSK